MMIEQARDGTLGTGEIAVPRLLLLARDKTCSMTTRCVECPLLDRFWGIFAVRKEPMYRSPNPVDGRLDPLVCLFGRP